MKKYDNVPYVMEELKSIVCDVCKKEYFLSDILECQEFIDISHCCGYGSVFGDSSNIECDICQHCAKRILGEYVRQVF